MIAERLDHVAIAAANTVTMAAWYGRVLGMQIVLESGPNPPQKQKVFLVALSGEKNLAAGMMVEIMPRNDEPRHLRGSHDPGLSHVAWYVRDFDAALSHLRENNVKFLSEVIQALGGGRLISFADCEGNMMQIVERLQKS